MLFQRVQAEGGEVDEHAHGFGVIFWIGFGQGRMHAFTEDAQMLFVAGQGGPIVHLGGALNYRIGQRFEVYACAATSTLFFVPVFHFGTHIHIFKWLSVSGNLKMALSTVEANGDFPPAAFMVSLAPRISFSL